ncbi:hypothetical protein ACJ72_01711 [Emergomyces africanus]|uniref:Reverse transcriptase Ty1/copia-type domain-containing protein n=1 Tax=Emergomyces africanus TaxID=1955775 RepID=A0A1B7P4G5_9EURO|nr:hypothetical protein ACJ72_01711 [Emergomyces africanus]
MPKDHCHFSNDGIIIFFYVDVILSRPDGHMERDKLIADLTDLLNRKLWLCQDAYIDNIVHTYYNLSHAKYTPLSGTPLEPYKGLATPEE